MKKIAVFMCMLFLASGQAMAAGKDSLNPYVTDRLPTGLSVSADAQDMLDKMGAKRMSLSSEAAHRPNWKAEAYPILMGGPRGGHEVLFVFDFADAERSLAMLKKAQETARSLNARLVPLALSSETYGTTLMGMVAWTAVNRPQAALDALRDLLAGWADGKRAQRSRGVQRKWTTEYDSAKAENALPLHCLWLESHPALAGVDELNLARYAYDAGNINMYQASAAKNLYGLTLPAIVVDGKKLR